MLTYTEFLHAYRTTVCDRPRAAPRFIRNHFHSLFPDTQLGEDWTDHDVYLCVSYHLHAQDLLKQGKPLSDKLKTNIKACKVMLTDLDRGRSMFHAGMQSIHKVFNESYFQNQITNQLSKESSMSTSTKPTSTVKSAPKATAPKTEKKEKKEPKPTIRSVAREMIVKQSFTDGQINQAVKKATGKTSDFFTPIRDIRRFLNEGLFADAGFPAPKKPYIEILSAADRKDLEKKQKEAVKETTQKKAAPSTAPKAPVASAKPEAKVTPKAADPKAVTAPAPGAVLTNESTSQNKKKRIGESVFFN